MSEPLASAPPSFPQESDGVTRLSERALQGLLRERGWRAATAALCTELSLALGCRRVALGWLLDGRVRVVGLYAAKEAGRNRVRYAPGVQAAIDLGKSSTA